MPLATALALLITGCAQQTFTVLKTNWQQQHQCCLILITSAEPQKKTIDAAKICGGAENVVKTETQQHLNIVGFIISTWPAGSACVLFHIDCEELPNDKGNSICTAH